MGVAGGVLIVLMKGTDGIFRMSSTSFVGVSMKLMNDDICDSCISINASKDSSVSISRFFTGQSANDARRTDERKGSKRTTDEAK